MLGKLCLTATIIAGLYISPVFAAEAANDNQPADATTNHFAWMATPGDSSAPNMFGFMHGTMSGQPGFNAMNLARPEGWAMFMNPATYPMMMNPATYAQFMNPNFYTQFANPVNLMSWMNPMAYSAYMNPNTYMQMMNPMAYMQFMNPNTYMQMMNPGSYSAYVNPNTYFQWMNPSAYSNGEPGENELTNFMNPDVWAQMFAPPQPADPSENEDAK